MARRDGTARFAIAWQLGFARQRAQIAAMTDRRFCRMWEYYLAASEAAFLYGDHFFTTTTWRFNFS